MAAKQSTNNGRITTALIYTRVSKEDQAREGVSLDAQLAECRRYVAQHDGWVLGREYQDVLSGRRDDRQDYQALLAQVRRLRADGQAVAVVVMRLDRFGRKVLERVRCREELKALGVPTHSVREGGEVSDLVANILASVAEEEVRQIGERIAAAKQHIKGAGWYPGGRPPWGYRLRDATEAERDAGAPRRVLDLQPATAPYVREAFERVARGESARSVAGWIAGLPAGVRYERALSYQRVRQMLSASVYVGRSPQGVPDVLSRPIGRWPRLIDDATYGAVQTQLARHAHVPRQASGRFLLTGLLPCPSCGLRMRGQHCRRRGYDFQRYRCEADTCGALAPDTTCRTTVPASRIEATVIGQVEALVTAATVDPSIRAALHRAWNAGQPAAEGNTPRVQAPEQEAAQAWSRLTRAAVLFADGDIDKAGYELLRDKARADLDAATAELARLGQEGPTKTLPPLDTVLWTLRGWGVAWAAADVAAQREVLALLLAYAIPVRVQHGRYTIEIKWTPVGEALQALAATAAGRAA